MARKKKTKRQRLRLELEKLVKDYAKSRDNHTCWRCQRQVYGTNCQGAHVIPVSACGRLAFDAANIMTLCNACHRWWHLHVVDAGNWFLSNYPLLWDYLQTQKRIHVGSGTIPTSWYEERIEAFRRKTAGNCRHARRR